jgi:hypothetical protein
VFGTDNNGWILFSISIIAKTRSSSTLKVISTANSKNHGLHALIHSQGVCWIRRNKLKFGDELWIKDLDQHFRMDKLMGVVENM